MLYITLFKKGFQRMLAYRAATLAGVLTNFFFGLLRAYVFIAVFKASGKDTIGAYTVTHIITYTALTQVLIAPLYLWGWVEISNAVRSGQIVSDLTKPYSYFGFWLARDLGRALFHLVFRGLPIMLFFPLFFELSWPGSPLQWGAGTLSLWLAVLISFAWRFAVNVSAFWLLDAVGLERFAYLTMTFFSGFVVPVSFFPQWLQAVVNWTPLPAMVNTPIGVYLGLREGAALWGALGLQLFWFVALAGAGQWLYHRGVRRLVLQGG